MSHPFDDYGKTVCTFVRHATTGEKEAIRQELADHMEDHAAALMDAGYDEEHAQRVAVEAMGDAEEVGRALNKEYPLRWLVLHRTVLVLLVITFALLLIDSPLSFYVIGNNLSARIAPEQSSWHPRDIPPVNPLSLQHELPGHGVLSVYGTALQPSGGQYTAYVCTVVYNKSPFQNMGTFQNDVTFTSGSGSPAHLADRGGGGGMGALYTSYTLSGIAPEDTLSVHYDHYGYSFDLEIPLPWEEVSP